ncbi:hypothetical protein [Desulforhopalus sp. IMCC35007]|uniref:hypothetical protein n=1 Tax=Desulforhopalus sp. IMCC35007 TaxID=2569543 RepID=UPI0010AEB6EB|nr:hypothetical protein [Desulforhopalus sp. IMCC35007]TKB07190.1 hypothetical protein FCL48_18295 [Desulforhopalus sp. IMCC35007]
MVELKVLNHPAGLKWSNFLSKVLPEMTNSTVATRNDKRNIPFKCASWSSLHSARILHNSYEMCLVKFGYPINIFFSASMGKPSEKIKYTMQPAIEFLDGFSG